MIHVSAHLFTLSPTNLVKLGLITPTLTLTSIGSTCLDGDMDIRGALFVEVATKLGVEVYARIASAFIATGMDLFSNPLPGVQKLIPLTDEQLVLASERPGCFWPSSWRSRTYARPGRNRSFRSSGGNDRRGEISLYELTSVQLSAKDM